MPTKHNARETEAIVVGLVGNPNSGKTTLFNNLTGSRQYVGNWPGVTVEKKEGTCRYTGGFMRVVDLPGVYGLTAYSPDEVVARNYILDAKPNVVVDIVDGSSLERHLYLTIQLLEMGAPVIMALNMMDVVESKGYSLDVLALKNELGIDIVPMAASRNRGTEELVRTICQAGSRRLPAETLKLNYGRDIEAEIESLEAAIGQTELGQRYSARWLAVKLLEQDGEMMERLEKQEGNKGPVYEILQNSLSRLGRIYGDEVESIIADARYGFIAGLIKDILHKPIEEPISTTDRIDRVLVHKWAGIPIFIALMFVVFQFVFTLSAPMMDGLENLFVWMESIAIRLSPEWLGSLLGSGIIGGLGAVLVFIPPIFLMFIAIAVLEDTGYMARAAFIMDRVMHKLGLHGRSFIPLVLGFGCSIPAIMACRTIDNPRDRLTTILVTPFISCGARLPIYVLFAGVFFPGHSGLVVFGMYILGIFVAVLFAFIFRKTIFRGESAHFVMELPPYRLPTFKSIFIHTWERGRHFLARAATVILAAVMVVWLLASLPWGVEYASQQSWLGSIGEFISPALSPAGFGQWPAAISLMGGFVAKEVVVATLGTALVGGSEAMGQALVSQLGWGPLNALAFMVFCLLYIPCVATISVIRSETGSGRWALFSAGYTIAVAWIAATLIFQIGSLFI